ncbi:hypothetical protein FOF52_06100 [Thermobifida alba]|uniref:Uncharacterized protein n=1 Tax=Thermobifida alba TaxID=53522 RepID=A0ABY4KYT7_THEAE|nr:hypothetical protein [Thermobifida alba]UPT20592.1 hypothetical protein FOF52_06100 [Thermobifida alba]
MAGLLVLLLIGFVIWVLVRTSGDSDDSYGEGGAGTGVGGDDGGGGGGGGE